MQNFGTQFSTTEGWGALLLTALTVIKSFGWIPADVDPNSLVVTIGQVVVGIVTLIAVLEKIFRKGSTPFVADPAKPASGSPTP